MTRARRHQLAKVLAVSTAGHPVGAQLRALLTHLSPAEAHDLVTAASRHGVTGFVCEALLPLPELDDALRTELEQAHIRVLHNHLRALSELSVIAEALDASGSPWLLFKGPALAAVAYQRPHLREYLDLDVLVPPEDLGQVLERLTDVGCRVVDRDWADLARERAGEVKLLSPGGVPIDLHWELCNEWRVRQDFRVPATAELVSRARTVRLQGMDVLTLDPIDTLLHVALHAATSGGWRLLWLKDVAQCLRAPELDVTEAVDRARSWKAVLVVAAMLQRSDTVLDTGLRAGAGRHFDDTGAWLGALAMVDRLTPMELATGGPSLTRILTRSTRGGTLSSAAELVRRSACFARRPFTPRHV